LGFSVAGVFAAPVKTYFSPTDLPVHIFLSFLRYNRNRCPEGSRSLRSAFRIFPAPFPNGGTRDGNRQIPQHSRLTDRIQSLRGIPLRFFYLWSEPAPPRFRKLGTSCLQISLIFPPVFSSSDLQSSRKGDTFAPFALLPKSTPLPKFAESMSPYFLSFPSSSMALNSTSLHQVSVRSSWVVRVPVWSSYISLPASFSPFLPMNCVLVGSTMDTCGWLLFVR